MRKPYTYKNPTARSHTCDKSLPLYDDLPLEVRNEFKHNLHDILYEFSIRGLLSSLIRKINRYTKWVAGVDYIKVRATYNHLNARKSNKITNQYFINDKCREKIKEKASIITQQKLYNVAYDEKRTRQRHSVDLAEIEDELDEVYIEPTYHIIEVMPLKDILSDTTKYYKDFKFNSDETDLIEVFWEED